jgi:hypothetical protein
MPEFVLALGVAISGLCLFLLVRIRALPPLLRRICSSHWLYGVALLCLLAGAGLIASAPTARFTGAVGLLGWLSALGGLALVAVPAPALRRMANAIAGMPPVPARLWPATALLIGLLFVYAGLA